MTHTQFVEFAYKTNRIYNFRVPTPSHPPPGIPGDQIRWIRIRISDSRTNWEPLISIRISSMRNSSIRISIRPYEFRPSWNSYTKLTNFVEFVWRISWGTNFVYTNFVSKPIRLYEIRVKGDEFGSRRISYTKIRIRIYIWGRNSYTKFVSKSNSPTNFRRGGGHVLSSPCADPYA